jgi:hypothetical protein
MIVKNFDGASWNRFSCRGILEMALIRKLYTIKAIVYIQFLAARLPAVSTHARPLLHTHTRLKSTFTATVNRPSVFCVNSCVNWSLCVRASERNSFLINYRGVFGMCEIYVENFRVYSVFFSPLLLLLLPMRNVTVACEQVEERDKKSIRQWPRPEILSRERFWGKRNFRFLKLRNEFPVTPHPEPTREIYKFLWHIRDFSPFASKPRAEQMTMTTTTALLFFRSLAPSPLCKWSINLASMENK